MPSTTKRVSTWDIIIWWELRRIPYNLAVGATGFGSVLIMELIASTLIPPGDDAVEPMLLMLGIVLFGIMANVCYTLGSIVEWLWVKGSPARHDAFRSRYFRLGLSFSCLLASLPFWAVLLAWSLRRFASRTS